MTKIKQPYHSTGQFRNVVKHFHTMAQFKGMDSEGKAVIDPLAIAPKVEYIGTTKLHGTNGSIIVEEDGTISFHSKNNLLGYVQHGEFTLLSDNSEFAQSMSRRVDAINEVIEKVINISLDTHGEVVYPIKISGEWAGQGVQKGVGISLLPKKSFFIFGIKLGETDQQSKRGWLPVTNLIGLTTPECNNRGIYSIADFGMFRLTIDFHNSEYSLPDLEKYTLGVEEVCPVAKLLQCKNAEGRPNTLGEGIVWTPKDASLCWDTGTWFKTKGQKHSVSKVKTVASVCPEKLDSIKKFVDYAVTENRLQQGLNEVGKDPKLIGTFIGWVNKDINKEEGDTLEASNLSMKDVGKYLTTKAREWYISKLQGL